MKLLNWSAFSLSTSENLVRACRSVWWRYLVAWSTCARIAYKMNGNWDCSMALSRNTFELKRFCQKISISHLNFYRLRCQCASVETVSGISHLLASVSFLSYLIRQLLNWFKWKRKESGGKVLIFIGLRKLVWLNCFPGLLQTLTQHDSF